MEWNDCVRLKSLGTTVAEQFIRRRSAFRDRKVRFNPPRSVTILRIESKATAVNGRWPDAYVTPASSGEGVLPSLLRLFFFSDRMIAGILRAWPSPEGLFYRAIVWNKEVAVPSGSSVPGFNLRRVFYSSATRSRYRYVDLVAPVRTNRCIRAFRSRILRTSSSDSVNAWNRSTDYAHSNGLITLNPDGSRFSVDQTNFSSVGNETQH